eukprot:TRINITY_DN7193_c0_g1_i1.p1 TRINITY_DN7193_c0_g1~~TRINITY_DN7193_c0_g1_i1.p1  ORF type:complete len:2215 (+),score=732.15 TRINITY_DN7193_c0_g1_i1:127-6771(+)
MKGFTSFLKEPPSESTSWFGGLGLGRKTKTTKNYVVTANQGGWDDFVPSDEKQEHTVPDVDDVVQESDGGKTGELTDSFGLRPPERERWRRNPQKTKMKEWWVADNMAKQCYECRSTFGVLTRRHHCRVCGQIFCWRCSANFLPGERLGFSTESNLRLCVCCYAMWQADKAAATDRGATNLGPLSTKAQGIARQATRARSASDSRLLYMSPGAKLSDTDPGSIRKSSAITNGVQFKSPSGMDFTPKPSGVQKLSNASIIDPHGALPQPDWDAGSDLEATVPVGSGPATAGNEWTIDDAETSFLTYCVGNQNSRMDTWRDEVKRLTDERLKVVNTPAVNDTDRDMDGMICSVSSLPDNPPIVDRSTDGDDATASIEKAAHDHLHALVYRLMADLIITGTDTRGGSQPTDDRLIAMMEQLKPLISRALWAKPHKSVSQPRLRPTAPPSLVFTRVETIQPPEDCETYAGTAAALIAGALLGQTIENRHDLDMAVIEAVRRRPDNDPESLVELVLGSPKISVCISKNKKVLDARCFENQFIKNHEKVFELREGVKWVMRQYNARQDEAIEGILLLYKRNIISPEKNGQSEPEQLDKRIKISGGEGVLDFSKRYVVVRSTQLIDDDRLTHSGYLEMLAGFREHSFEDDAKTIEPKVWTEVICRLAWKVAKTLFPSVWRDKDEVMDIREYIKVVTIEGGSPWDGEYVCGSVVKGNLANRKMPNELSNPRVLLVGDQIDFEAATVVTDFASLVQNRKEGVLARDNDGSWLDLLANKVKLMQPDLVLVEKSVNLKVQEQLCEAEIALATSIAPKSLSRVMKTTHATIVQQFARIPTSYLRASANDDFSTTHPDAPRLGRCKGFTTRRINNTPLLYLYGGDIEKGCAVVLRGASTAVLKRLKEVLKFAAFMAHNLVLETHYFEDAHGRLPDDATGVGNPLEQSLSEVRQNTSLLSSSLCVDFQIPDLLTTKRKRHDEDAEDQRVGNGAQLLDVPTPGGGSADNSQSSLPHVDSMVSITSTPDDPPPPQKTPAERKKEVLLGLCRDLGYFNPMCHQSILVHHTITRVTAAQPSSIGQKPGGMEEPRDRAQSLFTANSEVLSEKKSGSGGSVYQGMPGPSKGANNSGGLFTVSAKDLASQAVLFGHLGSQKECGDEAGHHGSGLERHEKAESTLMRMPGDTCREFKKLLIEYYRIGRNRGSDIPLIFYLAEHFSLASSPMASLPKRQYSHNRGRLTVEAERVPDDEFSSDYILMWTYCKKCKRNVSPKTECSRYTLSYSFGKFLEASFYNFKVLSKGCNHSLHGDLVRCFGQTVQQDSPGKASINVQVKFDYQPVEVYTLEFPELEVTYDTTLFNNFVMSEYNDLLNAIEEGYKNVKEALDELETYEKEVGLDTVEELASMRARLAKECSATTESAQMFSQQVGDTLSAVTVMDMNAMRKDLHAALQGWGKEISERWAAARAVGDKNCAKPRGSKWRDKLKRDETGEKKASHHQTSSSMEFIDFTKLTQDAEVSGSEKENVGRLLSALSALERADDKTETDTETATEPAGTLSSSPLFLPPPPPSPYALPSPCGMSDADKPSDVLVSPEVASMVPGLVSPGRRGSSLPGLMGRPDDAKSNSSGMSPVPNIDGGMSPQPSQCSEFTRIATNDGLGESPPVKSPSNFYIDRRQNSIDLDAAEKSSQSGGVMPQIRKAAMKAKSISAASSHKEPPALKMPQSLSGPGVLVNLATGAEDLTVIVRLDEPTSIIAYTLCSEQYKRACQPNTPPSSPLRGHHFRSPYLFRGATTNGGSSGYASPAAGNGTTPPESVADAPSCDPGADHSALGSPHMTAVSGFPNDTDSVFNGDETVTTMMSVTMPRLRGSEQPISPDMQPLNAPPPSLFPDAQGGVKSSRQQDIDNLLEVLSEKMRRVEIKEFEEVTAGNDPKGTTHLRFACNVLCARQFAALRQYYCKGDETTFIASLSRCTSFAPTGGKTGASYFKSKDGRFVLKAVKAEEVQHFEQMMAKKYFEYIARAIRKRMPTILTKIMGVFKITIAGSNGAPTSTNWLLMDNLFYNRKIDRTFDLKGSRRNRYQTNQNAVLLDENLLHMLKDGEWLFTKEESKEILTMGVHNDTLMLRRNQIMDYSMLLGVDDARKEIYVGIIDYMRAYDMKKQLEWVVKSSGIMGGRGQQPTVVDPTKYKERFRAAMNNYFLMIPDKATPWIIKHRKYQTLTDPGSELLFELH